ncbi:MAG: O-antigen ligase family protein [Opitutaceae bacterium]
MKAPQPKLTERDRQLRDTFTPAESQLCVHILLTAFIASWLADPRSFWGLGIFMIGGGICFLVLKTHEQSHPFFTDLLWPKFWRCSIPIWLLLGQLIMGLGQRPVSTATIGDVSYVTIGSIQKWLPVTSASGTTWITILGFCALYLSALNLYLVPKSRSFFERVLPVLCFSSVIVCVFGYLQKVFNLQSPLFTQGTGQSDFFSFFPYDGHWAAFALIWAGVCTGLGLLSSRYSDSPDFLNSITPWYLTGAALLGATGFIVEARWPSAILLIGYSGMLLAVAINYSRDIKDKHSQHIALISGLLASGVFSAGIYRAIRTNSASETAATLHRAAIEMFKDSPLFGWGIDSYEMLAPFYVDDTLLGAKYDRASSDLLQSLAELGVIGTAVPILAVSILLYSYIKKKSEVRTTSHMLIGCGGVVAMAFLDTPYMSPAVFFSFFIVFFSALRWADLSRNRVDEVDAVERPALVTPEAERGVPFFTDEYQEKEK